MLTVHHLENSQSVRIVWLLEELQLPYKLKLYKRDASGLAPPEYKKISPLGTSPTITDGDDFALSESNAIIDYILDQAESNGQDIQNIRPAKSHPARTNYLFWYHSSASSFMFVVTTDSLLRTITKKVGFLLSPLFGFIFGKARQSLLDPRLTRLLELANQQLGQHDFLSGDVFTAADIAAIYPMDAALARFPNLAEEYPNCQKWLDRMTKRPAFQKALQKIGQDGVSLRY